MTPNDVLLLKCYDSASRVLTRVKEGMVRQHVVCRVPITWLFVLQAEVLESELQDVAGLTPHAAFFDEEGARKSSDKRHSIEVRLLVFYN